MPLTLQAPVHIFAFLNFITTMQFLMGGILPAAPNEFQVFIQDTLDVEPSDSTFYLGLLETALIATYCLSTVVVGFLSKSVPQFSLVFRGVVLWVLSGFALLLLGRMTTGMAEATFRVPALPIIDQITPAPLRSFWIGLYYAGICVGSGVVFIYGSLTARYLGWEWSFYICAITMAPCVHVGYGLTLPPLNASRDATTTSLGSMAREVLAILSSPVFVFSGLGIGVVNFSVQAMVTFTPAIVIGLNVFDDAWAATIFGILTVVAGLVGAPLAGILLDRAVQGRQDDALFRRRLACYQRLWFQLVVLVAGGFTIGFLRHSTSWLFVMSSLVFLGAIFATFGSTTISMLLSVSSEQRGLAMGLALLLQNLIGNVPGHVVFGAIKVRLAPGCGSVTGDNGVDHVSPECASESNQLGLRIMWTWMVLWMLLGFLFWAIALYNAKREEVNCATEIVPTPQAVSDHVDYLIAVESQT
ncbi:unnamed protein product [Aphanomyces euteiches]